MNEDARNFQKRLKHTFVYIGRILMQTLSNVERMIITQQLGITLGIVTITSVIYFSYGLITWEKTYENFQAGGAIVVITALAVVLISFVRAPFQLDRKREADASEKEGTIAKLQIEIKGLRNKPNKPVLLTPKNPESKTSPKVEPKLEPNILCLESYRSAITTSGWRDDIFVETNLNEGLYDALLATFGNEPIPNKQVSKLSSVKAQIFFYDIKDGNQKHRVHDGIWLEEGGSVWFDVSDAQKLLLGAINGLNLEIFERSSSGFNYKTFTEDALDVTVRLVGDNQWQKAFKFELRLDGELGWQATFVEEASL